MLTSCSEGTSNIFRVDALDDGRFDDDRAREIISISADNIDEVLEETDVPVSIDLTLVPRSKERHRVTSGPRMYEREPFLWTT